MNYRGMGRHDVPISFRWDLPRIDPALFALLEEIKRVRVALGQSGVQEFIAQSRIRGYLECSDEDATRLGAAPQVQESDE